MTQKEIEEIRSRFSHKKDKRILIYGTKVYAEHLVTALYDFSIIGVLDQYRLEGEFWEYPILDWDDVSPGMADVLIIGSNAKYYDDIYRRIMYRCAYLGISVLGYNGLDLDQRFRLRHFQPETAAYFKKNAEQLKTIIDSYDAVSFDLFDTLVMRKTLEPMDIFDLVEERMSAKGIELPDFRKRRRTAELNVNGKDIFAIYKELGKLLGLEDSTLETIMKEELACEKDNLILRTEMAEIFHYAADSGKKVSIITDMYLTADILDSLLSDMGISGYRKIYVSCEYGKGKGNGLFEEYRRDVKGLRCLHIGDNKDADITAAEKSGLDAYEIKSSLEMLKISSMRRCLPFVISKDDRRIMGQTIAVVFNSPFALCDTAGILHIRDCRAFAQTFFVPLIIVYMQKVQELIKVKQYKGILFTARDGYLFKKIYDAGWMKKEEKQPETYYFLTSRSLVLKASVFEEEDIEDHIKKTKVFFEKGNPSQVKRLLEEAEETRRNYLKYFKQAGIDRTEKYLVCDLISQGTVLGGLNRIFTKHQQGLFLAREGRLDESLLVELVYDQNEWKDTRSTTCILEKVFTSLEPSVIDMDKEGNPVFSGEDRSDHELETVKKIHQGILKGVKEFYDLAGGAAYISKELAQALFYIIEDVVFCGEVEMFNDFTLLDDLTKERLSFKRK